MSQPLLGIQLYSLRREFAADAEGTLRQIRSLGFDHIELAGTYDWSADRWKALLAETGLKVVGAHLGPKELAENLPAQIAFQQAVGNHRYILPYLPEEDRNLAGYRAAAALLNRTADAVQSIGGKVYYHHHDFEFQPLEGGVTGLDILFQETNPAKVSFEIDTYWVEKGGKNSYQFIADHASRIGMIHAKEIRLADKADVPAGKGDVNFASILSLAKAGAWPVVVEFEGEPAIPAVRESAGYLKGLIDRIQ